MQIHYGNGILLPCASPIYLAARGTPETPEDLSTHTGVILESSMRPEVRYLQKDGQTRYLRWKDEIRSNSAGSALTAVLYGAGIHPGIPVLHSFRAIEKGELRPVLPGWTSPSNKLYIYARSETVRLKRVRVFIERYRTFIDKLHARCEEVLRPYAGDICLRVKSTEE